ncbi:MAG: YciI family protein [Planctomycetes bacterium]|nr:YciI family protein [Planctomycetota bacterium]
METADYIYVLKPRRPEILTDGPTDEEAAAIERHVEYLQNLAKEGKALLFGRTMTTGPETFGIVLLSNVTGDEARTMMENDPGVHCGVHIATLYPFGIVHIQGRG